MTASSVLPVHRIRDLTLLDLGDGRTLVVACDSVGSIGDKPGDSYPASPATVAHFAVRVPLLEVLCAGATPELVVDALSVELEPTGSAMIDEIRRVVAALGLGPERVTGSTEDNVPTTATGVGVTVIATASTDHLRPGRARAGDLVLCLGTPVSAPEDVVEIGDRRMVALETVAAVAAHPDAHELLPVGSRGIGHELGELAGTAGLAATTLPHDLDPARTAGPSSCVLAAIDPAAEADILALLPADLPRTRVATLAAA
ncbi:MAG TPA: AIR synthase related protein [Pseudolysinimonas sp.]|nr:AIR synthase related protein [Pseudolysinimonas sp.]